LDGDDTNQTICGVDGDLLILGLLGSHAERAWVTVTI
jgi:hypothetical protein